MPVMITRENITGNDGVETSAGEIKVKVDNVTVFIDANGQLTLTNPNPA